MIFGKHATILLAYDTFLRSVALWNEAKVYDNQECIHYGHEILQPGDSLSVR